MVGTTPEWRFGSGWTDEAVSARLAALVAATEDEREASSVGARPTVPDPASLGSPEHVGRLRHLASTEVLAREGVGVPEPGGLFARACDLVAGYELSDPAIVTAHFDRTAPLLRRPMLLEIRVLGLRYLCAVVVSEVLAEADEHGTRFAFRVDTLTPHLERGSEWFILTKNHRDGLIRLSITAFWEPGQFPNRWSRLGFALLARRYQRAWHRRAFRRLRDRLIPDAGGAKSAHAAAGRSWTALARIGAVAGLRTMLAPALVSRALERAGAAGHGLAGRVLASPAAGGILTVVAAFEVLADKLPMIPARIAPASLVARAISGAWAASAVAAEWGRRHRGGIAPALVGAASAVAAAFAGYHLRRWVRRCAGLPDAIVAVVEDVVAVALGARTRRVA
jgi:uncharacterized membrane protein/uncharacterized protein (UPF0548 family)